MWRRSLISPFVLAASLILVAWFLFRQRGDLAAVLNLDRYHVAALLALQLSFLGLQIVRTKVLLERSSGKTLALGMWARLFVFGRVLNLFVPHAAVPYRSVALKHTFGIGYAHFAISFVVLVWLTFFMSLVVAVGALIVVEPGLRVGRVPVLPAALLTLALMVGMPIAGPLLHERLVGGGRNSAVLGRVTWALDRLNQLFRDSKVFAATILGLTAITVMNQVALFYMALVALDLAPRLASVAVFYGLQQVGNLLVLTPGNLGVQELAYGIVGVGLGMSVAQGVLLSGILRVSGYAILLPAIFVLEVRRVLGRDEENGEGSAGSLERRGR